MNEEDREDLAQLYAGGTIGNLGIIGAIWVQLSVWDLLWFGLALYTAFRMLAGVKEEDAELTQEPAAV